MIDVLVVGGGPVGLATALHAHAAGLRVEVLESRQAPIDKACGEALMPSAVAALAELGVDPQGVPLRGIRYVGGSRRVEAPFPRAPGRGVRRLELHRELSAAAADRGIPVHREVDRIRADDDTVTVGSRQARYLVGADGLHSTVRRAAGLDRHVRGEARYGLRRHYLVKPWTDLIEVHWTREAEAYLTPVDDDTVGVAVLSTRRGSWREQLAPFTAVLLSLVGAAEPVSEVRGAGPLRQRAVAVARGRVALVGDAAGYIDAITGEGLSTGLAAAAELVNCLRADRLEDYPAAYRRVTWRADMLTRGVLVAAQTPALRRAIVPAASWCPLVYRSAVRLLAR